jgi:hypothetical protein
MLWIIGTGLLGVLLLGNLRVTSRPGAVCLVIIGVAAVVQYGLMAQPVQHVSLFAELQASPETAASASLLAQNN